VELERKQREEVREERECGIKRDRRKERMVERERDRDRNRERERQ